MRAFLARYTFILALFLGCPAVLEAAAAPSPAQDILVIYTAFNAYQVSMMQAFTTAFGAISPAPAVTLVDATGNTGFAAPLLAQTGKSDLFSWCQVYDLRFRDDKGNVDNTNQPLGQDDMITSNDAVLFDNYLDIGGNIFFQGDQHDFYTRNTPLLNYLNSIATAPITQVYPNAIASGNISTFSCAAFSFCNNFNNLSGIAPGYISGNWPGGISIANLGSAQALMTEPSLGAVAMVYAGSALKRNGGGKVAVSWESNAYCEPAYKNATSQAVIQNYYALLYGCEHIIVSKSFSTATACVGDPGSFTICTYNIGPNVLSAPSVYDTIPTCLSFQSSSPAPSSSSSNYYQWTLPNVAVGVTSCVTVNFMTSLYPPCP